MKEIQFAIQFFQLFGISGFFQLTIPNKHIPFFVVIPINPMVMFFGIPFFMVVSMMSEMTRN